MTGPYLLHHHIIIIIIIILLAIIIVREVGKWKGISTEQTICHLSYFINIKKSSSELRVWA